MQIKETNRYTGDVFIGEAQKVLERKVVGPSIPAVMRALKLKGKWKNEHCWYEVVRQQKPEAIKEEAPPRPDWMPPVPKV